MQRHHALRESNIIEHEERQISRQEQPIYTQASKNLAVMKRCKMPSFRKSWFHPCLCLQEHVPLGDKEIAKEIAGQLRQCRMQHTLM